MFYSPARYEAVQGRRRFATVVEETPRYRTAVLQNPFLIVWAEHCIGTHTHSWWSFATFHWDILRLMLYHTYYLPQIPPTAELSQPHWSLTTVCPNLISLLFGSAGRFTALMSDFSCWTEFCVWENEEHCFASATNFKAGRISLDHSVGNHLW